MVVPNKCCKLCGGTGLLAKYPCFAYNCGRPSFKRGLCAAHYSRRMAGRSIDTPVIPQEVRRDTDLRRRVWMYVLHDLWGLSYREISPLVGNISTRLVGEHVRHTRYALARMRHYRDEGTLPDEWCEKLLRMERYIMAMRQTKALDGSAQPA